MTIEVNESNFQREVIERSRQLPVVVDFWAEWCAPCRTLGPIIEGLAQEYGGRFVLAKLNVDENQQLAVKYGVQGIPAVKGFRDGRVAEEFVGALPRLAVRQFLDRLLPNPLEEQVAAGRTLLDTGKTAEAEARFRAVLAEAGDHPSALLGLAHVALARGQEEEALAALDRIPQDTPAAGEATRLRVSIGLRKAAGGASEADLRARVAQAPADLDARYALGSLLASESRHEEALDQFLEIVARDRGEQRNKAKVAVLHVFEMLGETPVTRSYRQRLANLVFA